MAGGGNTRVAPTSPSPTTPEVLGEAPATVPLEDLSGPEDEPTQSTRPLPAISLGSAGTHPLAAPETAPLSDQQPSSGQQGQTEQNGRRWPFGILGRRNAGGTPPGR
jgi:hypothetical protein